MEHDDDTLLDRAVTGDHEALALLARRHGPLVRAKLARAMPSRWRASFDVDDVMQQTYADAILAIRGFVPHGVPSFIAWLTKLGRNNLLNAIRGLEAEKRGGSWRRFDGQESAGSGDEAYLELFERLGGESRTASRELAQREARSALGAALATLPELHRSAVERYDVQGQPIAVVSAALGRSPGAVHMLRARAHQLLAERLGTASRLLSWRG